MKNNNYLYGKNIEVPEIPAEVKMRRIELLNDNLEELQKVPYRFRNFTRVKAVTDAITFWENIDN